MVNAAAAMRDIATGEEEDEGDEGEVACRSPKSPSVRRPAPAARAAPLSHDDSASHSNLNKMLLVSPRCGRTDGVSGCIGEMRSSGDGDTLQPKTFLPSLSRAARLLSPPSFFSPVPHCPSVYSYRSPRPSVRALWWPKPR